MGQSNFKEINFEQSVNYLKTLPDAVLINDILPQVPLKFLGRLCSTNHRFVQLCLNDRLWQNRIQLEYSSELGRKPLDTTWRKYYQIILNRIREIPVTRSRIIIGKIKLTPYSTFNSIRTDVVQLDKKEGYGYNLFMKIHLNRDTSINPLTGHPRSERFATLQVNPQGKTTVTLFDLNSDTTDILDEVVSISVN